VVRAGEPVKLSGADIRALFDLLNAELATSGISGEVYLVGGAVMCLVYNARAATRDVDAWFKPARLIREAAARVAARAAVPENWLNDAVKGYLSPRGKFDPFLELSHLRVFVAHPEYLLAMKCVAMRLGEEFHDVDDVRYLLRFLNLTTSDEALRVVTKYFDEATLQPKTRLALKELLPG
jgi:predicted nucleotidyltransferase